MSAASARVEVAPRLLGTGVMPTASSWRCIELVSTGRRGEDDCTAAACRSSRASVEVALEDLVSSHAVRAGRADAARREALLTEASRAPVVPTERHSGAGG